jgi:hypothetical protein
MPGVSPGNESGARRKMKFPFSRSDSNARTRSTAGSSRLTSDVPDDRKPTNVEDEGLPIDLVIGFAQETWRLRKRIEKARRTVAEDSLRGIRDSALRLEDLLSRHHVAVEDLDGKPYDEGLMVDVIQVIGDPQPEQPLRVIETIKPMVRWHERVLSAAQVILGPESTKAEET